MKRSIHLLANVCVLSIETVHSDCVNMMLHGVLATRNSKQYLVCNVINLYLEDGYTW